MPPRHRSQVQSGQLRSHSRSSSATRLGHNLQFTHQLKHVDKPKKNDFHNNPPPGVPKLTSNQRVRSRENLQPVTAKHTTSSKHSGNAKPKAGFTLSNQGDDDDDEWVSTESGAASPDQSDHEVNPPSLHERLQRFQLPDELPGTPRPSQPLAEESIASRFQLTNLGQPTEPHVQPTLHRDASSDTMRESPLYADLPPSLSQSSTKRRSRPPSMHSLASKAESTLRPHHLSYIPKQGPLAPLTVISDAAHIDPASHHDGDEFTTSPSSLISSDLALKRRASISSARSVSTVPVSYPRDVPKPMHERTRTLSSIPTSSSSAALSSLTHLPAITRPPSPQAVVFFPPQNPHANIDNVHPLLPSPYMSNHMTVLARRTPLRESYDRVIRAKLAAAR
ncbi:hypothetical protein M378DRAFT_838398 [Amanita muscaria Koide BX008]|uniref:Uncharacterized protein n=1 Tax=Amanita muscaria (strain Koide BX008) TaxID=946122 RepID=A0A0C2XHI7_AMAMK|nr:hypothetical protein M378DRAFT_838398 [Amanita muscaria Koide BX008]